MKIFFFNPDEYFNFDTSDADKKYGDSATQIDFHITRLSDEVGVAYITLIKNDVVDGDPPIVKLDFTSVACSVDEANALHNDHNQEADASMVLLPNHIGKAKLKIEYEFYTQDNCLIGVSKPTRKVLRYLEVNVSEK